jgi:hypothetical protein
VNTDEELHQMFRSATDGLDLPVDRVIAGGTGRGRRLRRRNAVTSAIGGVAAVAVAAPLAWVGATPLNSDRTPDGAAAPVASSTVQVATGPKRIPAFDSEGTADQLRSIVGRMVPGMSMETMADDGQMDRRAVRAGVVLRDAEGEGAVEIQVWPLLDENREQVLDGICHDSSGDPEAELADCTEVDGGTLAVRDSSWQNNRGETYLEQAVSFIAGDGLRVRVSSSNNVGVALDTLSPERTVTPLTLEQVTEIATDPRWLVEGEEPEPPAQPAIRQVAVNTSQAEDALAELVSEYFPGASITPTTTGPSGMSVSAAVLVDEGNGPSYVQVSLLRASSDFVFHEWLNTSGPCTAGCVETEAGKLQTYENHDDDKPASNGVYNEASFQRADGAYVSVSSANTAVSQYVATSTSRTSPLLSTKQLTKIAQSDVWVE